MVRLIGLGVSAVIVLLAACNSEPGEGEPAETPGVGGGPAPYERPISRADGSWIPPAYDPANRDIISSVGSEQAGSPDFVGTINGFRFFGMDDPEKRFACETNSVSAQNVSSDEMPFGLGYFPPGTVEHLQPYLQVCPNGETHLAARSFRVGPAEFSVGYWGGELAVYNSGVSDNRVKAATIHGKPGVQIEPRHPVGLGESMFVWPSGEGYIRVMAVGLPFDEVAKIQEAVTCADC